MLIRKLQFNIDYFHILTFREQYKEIISPYFSFENLSYEIENENTIHERIRLVFNNEKIALFIRKEGISIVFEGDVTELKDQNGVMKPFWDIFERIKDFQGYSKSHRHSIVVHSVELLEQEKYEEILKTPPYLVLNPFKNLTDFACVYESKSQESEYRFHFGAYSNVDLNRHDLSPFKTKHNSDLKDGTGLLIRCEIKKAEKNPGFGKFKSLLNEAEKICTEYKLST